MPRHYDDEDDDRPRRRRYEDDDEDDDDYRPRQRKKKRKASGPPVELILALVGGAGLLGLMFVGGLFFLMKRDAPPPMAVRPPAPPVFNPPPVNPPPVTTPDRVRPPAPKNEAKKPADEPTPAANPSLTVTAVRRGTSRFGKPSLEIDYTSNKMVHGLLVVKVKGPDGSVTEATLHGPPPGLRPGDTSGTWTIEQLGFSGSGFSGRLQVWVERKMGLRGETVSNVFTVE